MEELAVQRLPGQRLTTPSYFKVWPGKAIRMAREKSLLSLSTFSS